MVHELLFCLLGAAVLKARQDAYDEHGPFMPPEAYETVELCDRFLYDLSRSVYGDLFNP
jgi:hypothetical protein